jgi:hypothetical protein
VKLVQPNGLPFYGTFGHSAITRQLSSRILAGAMAVLTVIPLAAQSKDSQPHATTTFRADTRLVVLHAAVVDKSGHVLMNLPQKAFASSKTAWRNPLRSSSGKMSLFRWA